MSSQSSIGGVSQPLVAPPASVEFFAIQLSPAADGGFFVGIEATICEGDCELSQMECGSHHAVTLDDALAAIRQAVASVH